MKNLIAILVFLTPLYSYANPYTEKLSELANTFSQITKIEDLSFEKDPSNILELIDDINYLDLIEALLELPDDKLIYFDNAIEDIPLDVTYFGELLSLRAKIASIRSSQTELFFEQLHFEASATWYSLSTLKQIKNIGPMQAPFFGGNVLVNTEKAEVVYQRDLVDGGVSRLGLNHGEIILTFDDGPHPQRTPQILQILRKHQVPAIFFVLGRQAERSPHIVQQAIDNGNIIASHTYSHPNLPAIPLLDAKNEIIHGHNLMLQITDNIDSSFFRFPYGSRNLPLAEFLKEIQISSFFWNMDTRDWQIRNPIDLYNHTVNEINREQRGVLLFHDIHNQTLEILDHLLTNLHRAGYSIKLAVPNTWEN